MKRPKPTKRLLLNLFSIPIAFLEDVHHGLYETPLSKLYPNLNFSEVLAFAAGSWNMREGDSNYFLEVLNRSDTYGLFSEVFNVGFPWLNESRSIAERRTQQDYSITNDDKKLYDNLNPYKGRNLADRLARVDAADFDRLKARLREPVNEYVFDCQYEGIKKGRGGNNHRLVPMGFQTVYPRKGKVIPNYAAEISRIISNYPRDYEPLVVTKSSPANKRKAEQLSLL